MLVSKKHCGIHPLPQRAEIGIHPPPQRANHGLVCFGGTHASLGLPQILYGFIPEDARGCFPLMCPLDKMLLP